jgi:hypothetical protein
MIFVDIKPQSFVACQAEPTKKEENPLKEDPEKSGRKDVKEEEQTTTGDAKSPETSRSTNRVSSTTWGNLTTSLVVKSGTDVLQVSSLQGSVDVLPELEEEQGPQEIIQERLNSSGMLSEQKDSQVKYITTKDGIRQLNPLWETDQIRRSAVIYPFKNRATALPVVSYHNQENLFDPLDDESQDDGVDLGTFDGDVTDLGRSSAERYTLQPTSEYEESLQEFQSRWQSTTPQTTESLAKFDEYEEISAMSSEEFVAIEEPEEEDTNKQRPKEATVGKICGWDSRLLRQLQEVLARYEVPGGMLSRLLALGKFEIAEIIVDDSNDMNEYSDVEDPEKPRVAAVTHFLTRWEEAKLRLTQMMELVAYLPEAPIFCVRFLNRPKVLELKRNRRESPYAFLDRVTESLTLEFAFEPKAKDTSPAFERIRESFLRHHRAGTNGVVRYFLTHGQPDGGKISCQKIVQLLMYRAKPEQNPFTFLSCTDQDEDTTWMKKCEEVAPYCSEFDDYHDESEEILRNQGKAFPYSYGLHLVGQLVAAFNPNDLDAMDENVPFTKPTLSNLLGYQIPQSEYTYYFDSFFDAQLKAWTSKQDFQKEFINKLPDLFDKFEEADSAWDIVEVRNFLRRLKADSSHIARIDEESEQPLNAPKSPSKTRRVFMLAQDSVSKLMRHNSLPKLLRENSITRLLKGNRNDETGHLRKKKGTFGTMDDSFNEDESLSPRKKKDKMTKSSLERHDKASRSDPKKRFKNRRLSA